ncbi:MAG: hypothetical protein FWD09_05775 [Lentimicrobiaceae bacterium]|nr:hypothetical protein [Lentimicrobiaceae bacterium]
MTKIITKRHPLRFYALLVFVLLLFCGIGTLLIFAGIDILLEQQQPETKDYFMPIAGSVFYILAFSLLYLYWKWSPKITIDHDEHTIKFGNQIYSLKEIKDVILKGKMQFRYIFQFPVEGTAIFFNDGTEKILYDDLYSNIWEIKSFLNQTIINKQEYKPSVAQKTDRNRIRFEIEETFKGNQFLSFRGIFFWPFICLLAFMFFAGIGRYPWGILIFPVTFGTAFFILLSWQIHYFGLTENSLIVRNHNYIWMAKIYPLLDIKEVVFEGLGNQAFSMRIITNDFRNKRYQAGTLRDKTWLYLKDKLEAKGIIVRNECIVEKKQNE